MTTSAPRKLTGLKYAVTVLGAFGILAVAPATAFAVDNNPTPGSGGCTYTDSDGNSNVLADDGRWRWFDRGPAWRSGDLPHGRKATEIRQEDRGQRHV